jgi:hypothetical protein
MVVNATFNNITDILWRSVLLVEETAVSRENHHLTQVTEKFYYINHIISVKLPYTKGAPYPIVLVFWISCRAQGELKIGLLRLEANIQ